MPSYDQSTRTKLAEVVATPVTTERPTSLFADIANTTFLAAIALWLGGLASFIVLRAAPSSVLTSMKASWRLAAEALLPAAGVAAVQAVALTAVLQVLLDLNFGQVAQLLPFLLLGRNGLCGREPGLGGLARRGRAVHLGGCCGARPQPQRSPRPLPPSWTWSRRSCLLTPALEGSRAIASDGTGVLGSVGLLLAWLVVGAAAGVLAVARHRIARVPDAGPRPHLNPPTQLLRTPAYAHASEATTA